MYCCHVFKKVDLVDDVFYDLWLGDLDLYAFESIDVYDKIIPNYVLVLNI